MDRRNFIRNGGRLLMLGGMAGLTALLASRGQIGKPALCKIASHCGGCAGISRCTEPQAKAYLENRSRNSAGNKLNTN